MLRFCIVALVACAALGKTLAQVKLDNDPGAAMVRTVRERIAGWKLWVDECVLFLVASSDCVWFDILVAIYAARAGRGELRTTKGAPEKNLYRIQRKGGKSREWTRSYGRGRV